MLPNTKIENMDIIESAVASAGNDQDGISTAHEDNNEATDDNMKKQSLQKLDKPINYVKLNVYEIGCFFQLAQLLLVARKSGRGVTMSTINELFPETCDTFVSDFAVGVGVDYVEFGGLLSSDYSRKYTRLISIQKEMM